ncbi:MAG: hypothetical protein WC428_02735 [Candidatus Paceibacterota bacterium]|jgi:hypothetical protein
MNEKIQWFKKMSHDSMLLNYKKDGYLAPVFITFSNEKILITPIPRDQLKPENKQMLAATIKNTCKNPLILASVIIIEAYGAQIDPKNKVINQIMNGEINMSDIENKNDIIVMIFSSPEEDDLIAYYVDDKTKTIGKRFCEEVKNFDGMFSHLFGWNKN